MADPFGRFGSFGGFGALRSSLFGARDPFDDPFFSRPFEDLLEPNAFSPDVPFSNEQKNNDGKGVTIEELLSDEEADESKDTGNEKHSDSGKHLFVEHPDDHADGDVAERMIQNVNQRSDFNRTEGTRSRAHTFRYHTSRVTYGGVDGAYYTSSRTRRADSDGTVVEESKEADKTTGEARHRISRGIHDKGHSVTRKLNSDGRVDTTQTLHNLNEDELGGFEEAWKGNFRGHLPAWTHEFNMHGTTGWNEERERRWGGWLLPSQDERRADPNPSGSGAKKVVRINID